MSRRSYNIFLLLVFVVMVVLNHLTTPTLSDDVLYRFVFQYDETAPLQPIESFNDIINSQWVHYHTINGRIVIHSIVQAVLWLMNSHVFHVVNALLFVLLIHICVVCLLSSEKEKTWFFSNGRLEVALLFFTLFFVIINGFQGAFLWNVGSINYLWTTVVILFFLLYLHHIKDEPFIWKYVLLSPLAFLVGWSHEGIHLALTVTFIYYIIRERNKGKRAVFLFMLFFMAGSVCCMLSPALWSRVDEGMTLKFRLMIGVLNMLTNIRITWLLLLVIIYAWWRQKEILKKELHSRHYVYFTLLMALGVVFVCGTNSDRVGFFTDLIASLLLVSLLLRLNIRKQYIIGICSILLLITIPAAIYYNYQNYEHKNLIYDPSPKEKVVMAVKSFDADASWLSKMLRSRYVQEPVEFGYYIYYQAFNADNLNNRCAAALLHLKSVAFLPEDVLQKIHQNGDAYQDFELDEHAQLYIKRLDADQQVQRIIIKLNDEVEGLWFYQRLLTYPNDEYEVEQFKTLDIEGKRYLIFTKPTTNIYRRIKEIVLL